MLLLSVNFILFTCLSVSFLMVSQDFLSSFSACAAVAVAASFSHLPESFFLENKYSIYIKEQE